MDIFLFTFIILIGGVIAGFLGSLTGLGGGIVITPLLSLILGIDIRYAIGASLVSVIATSSGAAAAYVKEGFTNIRVGMFLEVATTLGALFGVFIALRMPLPYIALIFGLTLVYSALVSGKNQNKKSQEPEDRLATALKMNGTYPSPEGPISYNVRNVPAGFGLMFIAGLLSGLLGIGSGAVKVLAMDKAMHLPFKVSTTTSNFMIGVTAAASAGIYLNNGYIDPVIAMPVTLGVLLGSFLGARRLLETKTKKLRLVFRSVIFLLALEMVYTGLKGIL